MCSSIFCDMSRSFHHGEIANGDSGADGKVQSIQTE